MKRIYTATMRDRNVYGIPAEAIASGEEIDFGDGWLNGEYEYNQVDAAEDKDA